MVNANLIEELKKCWLTAIIGVILFIFGTSILFYNEGRAIHLSLTLEEALNEVTTINPFENLNSDLNGKLIHCVGPLRVAEPLTEPDYNIMVQAVKLFRRVEMYQWSEESVERHFGESVATVETDERTYYYVKVWSDKLIDSRSFYLPGHNNPTSFPMPNRIQVADHVFVGKYIEVGKEVKDKIHNFLDVTSDTRPEDSSIKMHSGAYYHSEDLFDPQIGDIRIQFQFSGLEGDFYTVVGKFENGKLVPYVSKMNRKVLLVYKGEMTLEEVFKQEKHNSVKLTWGFRFFGWMLLFLSTTCSASLLHYLFIRNRLLACFSPNPNHPLSTNIMISLSTAFLITAFAWIAHRPYIGVLLLLISASPIFYCIRNVLPYQRFED